MALDRVLRRVGQIPQEMKAIGDLGLLVGRPALRPRRTRRRGHG
jgi:hypothetical protein